MNNPLKDVTNEQLHGIIADRLKSTLASCYRSMIEMRISDWMEQAKTKEGIDYELAGCPQISDVVWDDPELPGISHLIRASSVHDLMEKLPLNSLVEFMDEDAIHSLVASVIDMYRVELTDCIVQRCTSHVNSQLREIAINQKQLLIDTIKGM